MAHLTNFSFEYFYAIFTEDASLLLLYHGAKKSKMTKNSNQGGPALSTVAGNYTVAKPTCYVQFVGSQSHGAYEFVHQF